YIEGRSGYSWQLVSETGNGVLSMKAGSTTTITVVAKNTGNVTWHHTDAYPIKLGLITASSPFANSTWPALDRPAIVTETSVAPGSNGTFQFQVTAPTTPGNYQLSMNPLAEGIAWFPNAGLNYTITVTP